MSTSLTLKERIAAYDRETKSAPVSTAVSPTAIDTSPASDNADDVVVVAPRADSPFSSEYPYLAPAPCLTPPLP